MNDENNVFDDIKKYQQQGRLVFFVGSGISRLSGYPSWSELVERMADEIKYDYKKNSKDEAEFSSDELLKIPQMFYNQEGKKAYKEFVLKIFQQKKYEPNEVHRKIFEFSPSHILTTNYDCLLEDTATMVGKHYSIINSDSAIDKVENPNYIVKVHGDFSSDKDFVLKEDDYLNYENNYKLTDNLVKSIFSTNLVIFIGYSLVDYNIKLIFNWVKIYQGDNFKPVFIYNEENKINSNNRNYLERKGLRVIDSHDCLGNANDNFGDSSSYYKVRYLETLTKLEMGRNLDGDREKILKYIFNKIEYANKLSYLRKKDFDLIFAQEYTLGNNRVIENVFRDGKRASGRVTNYFEDFFEHGELYSNINNKYVKIIKKFLCKNNIKKPNAPNLISTTEYKISELAFINEFSRIENFCNKDNSSLANKMKKAYYLAVMGEYVESYNLYTELLQKFKTNKNWTSYYICQVNRIIIYVLIRNITKLSGMIVIDVVSISESPMFNDRNIQRIKDEMKNFTFTRLVDSIPYKLKQQIPFLKYLSVQDYYEKQHLENISNHIGWEHNSSFWAKKKEAMLESVKFVYDNTILFFLFGNHDIYVKSTILKWMISCDNDIKEKKYVLTFQDIVLISKTFSKYDIKYLEENISLNNFSFKETTLLKKYIATQVKYYTDNFLTGEPPSGGRYLFWLRYSSELIKLISVSVNFINNLDISYKVIELIVDLNSRVIYEEEKGDLIYKWVSKQKDKTKYVNIFEKWLIKIIDDIDSLGKQNQGNTHIISRFDKISELVSSKLLKEKFAYTFNSLSRRVLKSNDKEHLLKGLFYIEHLLDDNAKQFLKDNPPNIDLDIILEKHRKNETIEDDESINIIIEALESEFAKQVTPPHSLWKYPVEKSIIALVGIILSNNLSSKIDVEKYFEKNQNFDFLMSSDKFDESEFDIKNFCLYTDLLLKHLKENSDQKKFIISKLKNLPDFESVNKEQASRLFHVYKFMLE